MKLRGRKMMIVQSGALILLAAGLVAGRPFPVCVLSAQNQLPKPPGTIRVRVRLVPVDVTVTDEHDKPVTNLKQEDFRIFEDGREQEIRHFLVQKLTAAAQPLQPQPQASPRLAAIQPEVTAPELTPQTGRTFLILMGHGRHQTPFKALDALIRFVRTGLMPQDRVAVFAYTRITDFTTDHEQIARLLERFRDCYEKIEAWREEQAYMVAFVFKGEVFALDYLYRLVRFSKFMQSAMAPIFGPDGTLASHRVAPARMPENATIELDRARAVSILGHAAAAETAGSTGEFGSAVVMTELEQWEAAAFALGLPPDIFLREAEGSAEDTANIFTGVQQLRYMDGEKHLLFFTEFGLLFPNGNVVYDDYIAGFAADARVAIDTFQTGGLETMYLRSPSYNKSLTSGSPPPWTIWAQSAMQATIKDVSQQTGGRAAVQEDIGKALDRINETTRVEYLLGYYPKAENWDGKYRQIEVKVNRPGLKVSFRHGYFARDTDQPLDLPDQRAASRIADAGASTLEIGDIIFAPGTTKATDAAGNPQLRVDLAIDPHSVTFQSVDGRHTAKLRIAIFYADENRKSLGEDWKTLELQLQNSSYQKVLQSTIPFSTPIPLKSPVQILKIVVYDMIGDRIGSKLFTVR